jgi:hypothetical protein
MEPVCVLLTEWGGMILSYTLLRPGMGVLRGLDDSGDGH